MVESAPAVAILLRRRLWRTGGRWIFDFENEVILKLGLN